jgi:pimeloyl-ACP methyl ester carboxylesterase
MSPMLVPLLASLTALLGAPLLHRRLRQRQHARRLVHTGPHAIAESRFVRLGGVDQWIGIRGEDRHNPILLILHGGPGCPYSIFTPVMRPWERHFTIVQWDRRGVGKTLGRTGKAGTGELGFPRMVDDAIELSLHLREHLPGVPLIALGGSMGNLVGIPLVQRRPDLFAAYVATDLGIDAPRGERLTWELTRERLRAADDRRGLATLTAMGPDPTRWTLAQWLAKQQQIMKTDPHLRDVSRRLLLPLILTAPEHSLRDVLHVIQGLDFAAARLFAAYIAHDARDLAPRFELPFFVFQGDADAFTPTSLACEYFAGIDAPHKQLALIREAGHFAAFTRPEQFLHELLTRVRPLVAPA